MKIKSLVFGLSVIVFMSSCVSTSFYQVYQVVPSNQSIQKSEVLFFEDENCKISYNLWSDGGDIGFVFYNKTDDKIYVNLDESNFVLNGFANDYFKNRTYTTSESKSAIKSNGLSVSSTAISVSNSNVLTGQLYGSISSNVSSSYGYSVSIQEDSIVYIPPKTAKRISEYSINTMLVRNCDLLKYPSEKQVSTISYEKDNSPIVFSNRITYTINGKAKLVTNEFFVSEVTNYPESEFYELKYDEYCGQKSYYKTKHYKHSGFDKFFIQYSKGTDEWKH
jgi:hypothetical protein